MTNLNLTEVDWEALTRAIVVTRQEGPDRAEQLDHMLRHDTRERVGMFAVGCAQSRLLRLDPWQALPFRARLPDDLAKPRDDTRGERRAAELCKKLLDAGLSRFEPDPVGALERAKAERRP
jgi:hypothetical protein